MLLLKATLVLTFAAIAALALRRGPASARHRLWSATFAALLALPVLAATLPSLNLPLPALATSSLAPSAQAPTSPAPAMATEPETPATVVTPVPETSGAAISGTRRFGSVDILWSVWLVGALLSLLALMVSVLRVAWLSRSADVVEDPAWSDAIASIARQLALRSPVSVRMSPSVITPMAGGFLRPTVFVPTTALQWDAERRDVVLTHELAHLAARDPQRHVLARVALSLYWFHPLAWFAARQATAAREAACDERVLSLGTRPSAYARVLLDLAESIQPSPVALATLPMVHKSSLEVRVMAILNGTIRPLSRTGGIATVLAVITGTLLVAAAAPRAPRPDSPTRWIETSPVTNAPQRDTRPATECSEGYGTESFSGTIESRGSNVISERVGSLNRVHRVILFSLDGTRLCMFGESVGSVDSTEVPSQWVGRAKRVIIEATNAGTTQRMVIEGGNTQQALWQVNGVARPIDRAATEWRDRMLAMFDARWELTTVRGEETSLRGQATSIQGQETSLRGQITSLRGHVTSMQGQITSLRGHETAMRGQITSIRGHETSLRGQITSAQGVITSLNAPGSPSSDASRRIAEQARRIEQIEREIQKYNADAKIAAIEKEIDKFEVERKVAEVLKQIDDFDVERKVEEIERHIADLKVPEQVRDIERQIDQLDVEKRVAEIQRRIEAERPRLRAAVAAIR